MILDEKGGGMMMVPAGCGWISSSPPLVLLKYRYLFSL